MYRVLKTPPASGRYPISKETVKELCEINNSQQDKDIEALIPAAVSEVERRTGRVFINQVWEIYYDLPEFANMMSLSTLKVNSIVAVNTYDRDNNASLMASTEYFKTVDDMIVFNNNHFSLASRLRQKQAMVVEVNAGYGTTHADMPWDLKSALAELVGFWLDSSDGDISFNGNIPISVQQKIFKYVKKLQWA
jgi:uncharacterized phiE125 gp8 family phage protein